MLATVERAAAILLLAGGCGAVGAPSAAPAPCGGAALSGRRLCQDGVALAVLREVTRGLPAGSEEPPQELVRSSGPRFGVVYVTGNAADTLEAEHGAPPALTSFGWQFRHEAEGPRDAPAALVCFVPSILGLEHGLYIPSVDLLFGVRAGGSSEFGAGPNLSPEGMGLTLAVATVFRSGEMGLPLSLTVVASPEGVRFSIVAGWDLRR